MGIEMERKRDKKPGRSSSQSGDSEREFDIPGQMSVFDNPEWLTDDLEEDSHE